MHAESNADSKLDLFVKNTYSSDSGNTSSAQRDALIEK